MKWERQVGESEMTDEDKRNKNRTGVRITTWAELKGRETAVTFDMDIGVARGAGAPPPGREYQTICCSVFGLNILLLEQSICIKSVPEYVIPDEITPNIFWEGLLFVRLFSIVLGYKWQPPSQKYTFKTMMTVNREGWEVIKRVVI